ncbi:ead/Ea22-like family protein [Escherichia coli]|nr:ead/Ea22-like family protein [Escherichia coli]
MTKINYQALREAAERAIPAMECLLMLPVDDDLISEQELKDYGVDIDALNAFKFLTGPETVLALLDERERNQQYIKSRDQENEEIALTVGKLRVELEAAENNLIDSECHVAELEEALRDKQALLEASEKRIAELEAEPVSQAYKLNALDGNSPVTPDGWVMVPKELTPEMMRAVQIRSELGGYATSNLSGAYNMFSEFWNVAVSAAPKVDDL